MHSGASALDLALPEIGDSAGSMISPEQERQIGEEFLRQARQRFRLVEDPEVNEYIQSLGYRLVAQSDNHSQDFTFFVIDAPDINAFAAPGGYIGVNTGLITATESESELASVMAHEIAHVTQRHLARAYETQSRLNVPALAGVVAALILGSQNSDLGQATLAATQAGAIQAQLNFTRSNEQEADDIGMQTLVAAEFDPLAMPAFFERLQQATRYYGKPPEFLSTHPVTGTRIAESRSRAERYPYRQIVDSTAYHLVREKLRVLASTDPKETAEFYRARLEKGQYRHADAARYGYALALHATRQYAAAETQLKPLLAKDPDRISYIVAQARNAVAAGDVQGGLGRFAQALSLYPHNHPLTMHYAEALLQNGKPAVARTLLREHQRVRTAEPRVYKLLALAEGESGHAIAAHQAQAEFHYLNGDLQAALQQLDIALKLKPDDFYQSAQLEARRREIQAERRALLRQSRDDKNPLVSGYLSGS